MTRNTTVLPLRSPNLPRYPQLSPSEGLLLQDLSLSKDHYFSCFRIHIDLSLERIALDLGRDQFLAANLLTREFDRLDRARKYRRFKPDCPILGKYDSRMRTPCTGNVVFIDLSLLFQC